MQIRRKLTVAESILQLAATAREAEADGGGVDPEEIRTYVQNILDAATFAKENQPEVFYEDMPDPPENPDMHVFSYRPPRRARPPHTDYAREIAYAVGEVSRRFELKRCVNDAELPIRKGRKPSAIEVAGKALQEIRRRRTGSYSHVRRHLTAKTAEALTEGHNDGLARRQAALRQN